MLPPPCPTLHRAQDFRPPQWFHRAGRRPDANRLKVSLDDPATLSFGRFDLVHSLRILGNLVDNSFQYAPAESAIEVRAGTDGDDVLITVRDYGDGIPDAERERVFLPLYRAPGNPTAQSSGLGLSIARRLAEAQNGSLRYVDTGRGGATFELRLPSASP